MFKLARYHCREILITFTGILIVVLAIAISHKFVRIISEVASGNFAPEIIIQLIITMLPELLSVLIPISLFLAILLSGARGFTEQEIPAMFSLGIGWRHLIKVASILGVLGMILVGFMTLYLNPIIADYRESLVHEEGPMLLMQTLTPGRFNSFNDDKLVLYVEDLNENRSKFDGILIAEKPQSSPEKNWSVLSAKSGQVITDKHTGDTFVRLEEGKRYDGPPGKNEYSILEFANYERLISETKTRAGVFYHRNMPTMMLIKHPYPSNMAELQWRISLAISVLVLSLLAVPLCKVPVRKGKFGRIFIAILMCLVYFNLQTASKRWVGQGVLPYHIGVWWVHILFFIIAIMLLFVVSGRWQQLKYYIKQKSSSNE